MYNFFLDSWSELRRLTPARWVMAQIGVAFLLSLTACASRPEPLFFGAPPGALTISKARLASGDRSLKSALDQLVIEADKALETTPLSVMEKTKTPPGGSKHDYLSQAPYFWPDPSKPDGLPYIRKDGKVNPESHNEASDSPRLSRMGKTTDTLALAYYFTGNEKYAEHAALLLRVWFLDDATKMNPNFNYAQAVLGVNSGRGTGMIESRNLANAADAAGLLEGSRHWSRKDSDGIKRWMTAFVDGAQTSKNGRDEHNAKNNHGSFYDMQITHLALFTGQTGLARSIVKSARQRRIARQIKADGSQPLELTRADSFGYSKFNVQALCELAVLGQYVGVDLWHYQNPDGGGLRRAIDFLMPYAEDPAKAWPYEHEKKPNRSLSSFLAAAWLAYGDERYLALLKQSPDHDRQPERLLFPEK